MYEVLRGCHRMLDRVLSAALPVQALRTFRTASQKIANILYPSRLRAANARELKALALSQPWVTPRLPEWVCQELDELSREVDPALHLHGDWVAAATFHSAPWTYSLPGDCYFALRELLPASLDVIILVPSLQGGAGQEALHFAQALVSHGGRRIALIATQDEPSPWRDRLAGDVIFVEAGAMLAELDAQHRIDVLVRLLLQVPHDVLHIMHSLLGWEALKRNGLALRQRARVFASLHCDEVGEHGQLVGHARGYLAACHSMLDGVISDNAVVPALWGWQMGVRETLFHVVRLPAPELAPWPLPARPEGAHVLWVACEGAGSCPELLARVAMRMPQLVFEVHGDGLSSGAQRQLASIPNVRLHGAYGHFSQLLPRHGEVGFVAFLHTAAWGGVPHLLLDAASAGLPIVAGDVGGVADFLDAAQRVQPADDAEGYVARLLLLLAVPDQAQAWRRRQFERISQAHTLQGFMRAVDALPGYGGAEPEPQPQPQPEGASPHAHAQASGSSRRERPLLSRVK